MSDVEKKASDTKDDEKERGSSLALRRADDYFREMDRMLDDFRRRFESSIFPFVDPWSNLGRKLLDMPESRHAYGDLIDAGNEYRVMVEVPGIPKDKLDIKVSNRQIRIEGEAQNNTEQKESGYVRRERSYSKLETTIAFPEEVIPDKAEANVNNGVLEVRIPKRSPTEFKERKIEVK